MTKLRSRLLAVAAAGIVIWIVPETVAFGHDRELSAQERAEVEAAVAEAKAAAREAAEAAREDAARAMEAHAEAREALAVALEEDEDLTEVAKGAYLGVVTREETRNPEGGARVVEVVPDSPADKAGIEDGDIVVKVGDTVVRGPAKLKLVLSKSKPGDKVVLRMIRDGKPEDVTVELTMRKRGANIFVTRPGEGEVRLFGELPEKDREELEFKLQELDEKMPELKKKIDRLKIVPPPGLKGGHSVFWVTARPRLGVELIEPTPELREFLGGGKEAGVLVGRVLSGTPAEKAGVRVGDLILSVDGEKVEEAGDLIDVLEEKSGKTIELELVRDKKAVRLKATLPAEGEEEEEVEPVGPRAALIPPPAPPAPPAEPAAAPPAPPVPPAPPARPL